ncbi:MAG TPA: hypothetical protein VJ983_03805, partial [candidate division Zixibacteria bacterium]|nr:hypothetical protein [candidate division Zixibacteria bacterium]
PEPIRPGEAQVKKEMIAGKASGDVSPKSVAKARIAGQSTGELAPVQKSQEGLRLFADSDKSALTLEQWKAVRDSLLPVVAALVKQTPGKGGAATTAFSDSQQEPVLSLLEAYSQIAMLTSDSLEYRSSLDSLTAYVTRKDELYRSKAETLLKQVENSKKAGAPESGNEK